MFETQKDLICPVCGNISSLFDVVDFNKSCEELRGKFLSHSGIPIYYALCSSCNFCYSPEISSWPLIEFENKIYNGGYIDIDPDYVEVRPRAHAKNLIATFGSHSKCIRHLDYGGGEGLLSKLLCDAGFDSSSYDPFVNKTANINDLGSFDLISAIEVFEHVPDVHSLMNNLRILLKPDGVVFFTTLTTDGNIVKNQRLTWWYASPRNGHISLFSSRSLAVLAGKYAFNFGSFNNGVHVLWKTIPSWASHLFAKSNS
jgi:SAM-dependent methyltransferase